jgi:hypothetical protein
MARTKRDARYVLSGEKNPNSRITDEIVDEIHRLFGPRPTQREFAAMHKISVKAIQRVLRGDLWKHRHPKVLRKSEEK